MSGIQACRNSSAPVRPPTWPPVLFGPAHVSSWPSLHRLGVMNPKRGVVFSLRRSWARWPVGDGVPLGAERPERDDVGVALGGVVDDGVEPDEGVVPGRVLVGRRRHLRRVGGADRRVRAIGAAARVGRAAVTRRACCPCPARRRATRRRVSSCWAGTWRRAGRRWSAPAAGRRSPRRRPGPDSTAWSGSGVPGVTSAKAKPLSAQSAWVSSVGRLAGDLGDVVVEAVVPDGVVVLEQLALRAQRAVQVGGGGARPERGLDSPRSRTR